MLAMAARIHLDATAPLLIALYLERGTTTNLLASLLEHDGGHPLLRITSSTDLEPREIHWRTEAMLRQWTPNGPLPFLAAIPSLESRLGRCQSCAGPLGANGVVRCRECVVAVEVTRIAGRLRLPADGEEEPSAD
jgi:hypothetical protein